MRKNSGDSTAKKTRSLSMEISYISRDRVAGERALGEEGGEDVPVRLGVLFDVADELSKIGIREGLPNGYEMRLLDAKTIMYHPRSADRISAEASLMASSGDDAVWVTKIADGHANIIAIVAQSFRKSEMISHPPAGKEHRKIEANLTAGSSVVVKAASKISLNRREQIALAACEVIARKGFANATIRDIADAANMHVPTLYQHLKSKDEILELVYNQVMDRIANEMEIEMGENPASSKKEELVRLLTKLLSISNNYVRQVEVINRETKSLQPEARRRVIEKYKHLLQRFSGIIQEGADAGEFRAVESFIVANLIESFCTLWALRPFSFNSYPIEQYRDEIISFMMYGISGKREGPARSSS